MKFRASKKFSKKRNFGKHPMAGRPSIRAWKPSALLDAVRDLLLSRPKCDYPDRISAEEVAKELRAKKSMVTAAFERLRDEGIIGHKIKGFACREHGTWRPSVYPIRKQT